jgi:hypothetical protein
MGIASIPAEQAAEEEKKAAYTPNTHSAGSPRRLNEKRPYYQEGLNPAQIAAPLLDLFASKQAVPYIEDQGAKNALAASTRQRFTDIQPQLNRLRRSTLALTRNSQNPALASQAYANEYEAANQVYGQKYNADAQIEQNYNNMQNELRLRAGTNKAQALDTLAQRTATRDWKAYAMRRNALGEIGNKYQQNLTENRASLLYQDMYPNYNYNPIVGTTYQGDWAPTVGSMFPYGYQGNTKTQGYEEEKWIDENGHEHIKRVPSGTPSRKHGGKVKLPKKMPKRK